MQEEVMGDRWYQKGLNFTCTRCSRCCRHDSGYVFLSETDISALASHFSLDRQAFIKRYCTSVDLGLAKRISLIEQENFDCVFWKDGGCSVYDARPLQCRAYPFWPQILDSPASWQDVRHECPGIDVGTWHSPETIESWLIARRREPFSEKG
jgi:Fe-S-cluster containining protein